MTGLRPDVVVVGGGIIGCAIARSVALAQAQVVVLERDVNPRHASWAAAGMLAPQAESTSRGALLDLLMRARSRFPPLAESLLREVGMPIGYRTEGKLLLAFTADDEAELDRRFELQSQAGLPLQRLGRREVLALEPSLSSAVRGALFFNGDHQVENRLLHTALRESAVAAGGKVRHDTALSIHREGSGLRIETASGVELSAGRVVLAAGSWSNQIQGLPRSIPVKPVHGQALSLEGGGPLHRHVLASGRGYLVPRTNGEIIVGATADDFGFHEETTLAGLARLAAVAAEISPALAELSVSAHWAGLRPGTPDGLPIIGPDPDLPALVYATGHYRNGILLAPITGEIVARLVLGEDPGLDVAPYRPDRFA